MRLKTRTFRLTRHELTLLSAAEYVRTFWWFVMVLPVFGVLALIFGDRLMQIVGFFAIAWPFTIPARAALVSTKASRLFTKSCTAEIDTDGVRFYGDLSNPKPLRWTIPWADVRDLVERGPNLVLRLFRWGFAPIPKGAFESDDQWRRLMEAVDAMREERALGVDRNPGS